MIRRLQFTSDFVFDDGASACDPREIAAAATGHEGRQQELLTRLRRGDLSKWLRSRGYDDIADSIEAVTDDGGDSRQLDAILVLLAQGDAPASKTPSDGPDVVAGPVVSGDLATSDEESREADRDMSQGHASTLTERQSEALEAFGSASAKRRTTEDNANRELEEASEAARAAAARQRDDLREARDQADADLTEATAHRDTAVRQWYQARREHRGKIALATVLVVALGLAYAVATTVRSNIAAAQAARETAVLAALPGLWTGNLGNAPFSLMVSEADDGLAAAAVFTNVVEHFTIEADHTAAPHVWIWLRGRGGVMFEEGSWNLDTLRGSLSSDRQSVSGRYVDTAGSRGDWKITRQRSSTPPPGTVSVRSNVRDDMVFVNDRRSGPTPATVSIPSGQHRVRVHKEGCSPTEEQVEVLPGQSREIRVWIPCTQLETELQTAIGQDAFISRYYDTESEFAKSYRMTDLTVRGVTARSGTRANLDFEYGWRCIAQCSADIGRARRTILLEKSGGTWTVVDFG